MLLIGCTPKRWRRSTNGRIAGKGVFQDPRPSEGVRDLTNQPHRTRDWHPVLRCDAREGLGLQEEVLDLVTPQNMHTVRGLELSYLLICPKVAIDNPAQDQGVGHFVGQVTQDIKATDHFGAVPDLHEPECGVFTADLVVAGPFSVLPITLDEDEPGSVQRECWRANCCRQEGKGMGVFQRLRPMHREGVRISMEHEGCFGARDLRSFQGMRRDPDLPVLNRVPQV
jgi:hypothetical protein